MTVARLALLLFVYVALDFANPLMPGAVNFSAEESVEGLRVERPRAGSPAAASAAPPPPESGALLARRKPRPASPGPAVVVASPARLYRAHVHASPPEPGDDAEDH